MKLSKHTLQVLKNFSTINPSIRFVEGKSELRTTSPQKTVIGISNVEETFPVNACIYDLAKFLSVYSLFEEPELEFGEKSLVMHEGSKKIRYTYADPSMIISPPEKMKALPAAVDELELPWDNFQGVLKAAAILGFSEIAFASTEGKVSLKAFDSSNPTTDQYLLELGDSEKTYELILKTENLKFMQADYKVSLTDKGIATFASDEALYYVAVESKSSFGDKAK